MRKIKMLCSILFIIIFAGLAGCSIKEQTNAALSETAEPTKTGMASQTAAAATFKKEKPAVNYQSGSYKEPIAVRIDNINDDEVVYYSINSDILDNIYSRPVEIGYGETKLSIRKRFSDGTYSDTVIYNYVIGVPVPDVVGVEKEEAEKMLKEKGFVPEVRYVKSEKSYDRPEIIRQQPEGGTYCQDGTRVIIEVPEEYRVISFSEYLDGTIKEELNKNDSDVIYVKDLANIKELSISGRSRLDLKDLMLFKNLEKLKIWDYDTSEIPPLKELKNLKRVEITAIPITDTSFLCGLQNLEYLMLDACQEEIEFKCAETLINLKSLVISRGTWIKDYGFIGQLPALQTLTLMAASNYLDLTKTGGSTTLHVLSTYGEMDSLEGISNFPALNRLEIYVSSIDDITPLFSLKNLEDLALRYSNIKNLEQISKLSKLKSLALTGCPLESLDGIEKKKNLKKLYLSDDLKIDTSILDTLDIEVVYEGPPTDAF